MRTKFCLMLIVAAAARAQSNLPPPPPDDAAQKKIITDVMNKGLAYRKELPDFVCTQVTRHSIDPTGNSQHWRIADTINEELTYVNGAETYRVVSVNGKSANTDKRPGSAVASTEFADVLTRLFDPKSQAELSWSNWDVLRGHRVHTIGFKVNKDHSSWNIGKGKGQITVGYFGVLNIDAETGAILKAGVIATDIPAKYPLQGVSEEYQYEWQKIGDHYYVVPLRAETHAKDGKMLIWNEVDFRDFHKPGGGSASKAK